MKKVLFFTYDFPYPTNTGGKNRAFHLIKYGGDEIELHLFSFLRDDFQEDYKKELNDIGVKNMALFPRKKVRSFKTLFGVVNPNHSIFYALYFEKKILNMLLEYIEQEKIDVVHFESFYTGFYISQELSKRGVKQIFGTENIEYKVYEEYAQHNAAGALRPIFINHVGRIKREEECFAKNSDVVIAVTQEEEMYFQSLSSKKTEVIPNGIEINEFKFKLNLRLHGTRLLFVGNFSYFPNRDAIDFFYNEVFLKMSGPYELTVIGKGATKLKIQDTRVHKIDFIPDIREAYYSTDVMVSPVRIGGGTNFKLLEAAACGTPIIAHTSRIKSIGLTSDEDVLSAADALEFAQKTEMLLNNDGLQGKLAKNARTFIEKNYSWEVIGKKMNYVWKTV